METEMKTLSKHFSKKFKKISSIPWICHKRTVKFESFDLQKREIQLF